VVGIISSDVDAVVTGPLPFSCVRRDSGAGAVWVTVKGELDIATVPTFADAMDGDWDDARLVVLDLRALTFIDARGVAAILDAASCAQDEDRRLIVVRAGGEVDRVFELTNAADRLVLIDLDPAEPPAQALIHLARRLS
jgi:anti-anti-sigma factor